MLLDVEGFKIPPRFCIIFYLPTQYFLFILWRNMILLLFIIMNTLKIQNFTSSTVCARILIREHPLQHKDRQMAVKGVGEIWTNTLFPSNFFYSINNTFILFKIPFHLTPCEKEGTALSLYWYVWLFFSD